ncbi:single-stranded DNA-binding protein [Staphylococcus schweitzeri]|uniref:Single-stranded DNA-binding protein n=1 Tax=Staphylococcus schweitzeri TaxID=1654388 RepID=A0A077UH19_9STAP|nr:single-stranded DNA-binding protein [Staphylococcus schweitzeri]CDR26467.1 ssDNA-binding protein [Staphylococcus schweitzeri]
MNLTILIGRLTCDPELLHTQKEIAVAKFNLAVNRNYKNENGQTQADFINCITFRKHDENVATYLKTGQQIAIKGRIQTRSYTNKENKQIYVTEVIVEEIKFLENKNSSHSSQEKKNTNSKQSKYSRPVNNNPFTNIYGSIDLQDDDLPF